MINLARRSYQPELLDNDDIPFEDIRQNMQELNTINRLLGGHHISLTGVRKLLAPSAKKNIHICEIGSGGGDNIKAIADYCRKHNIEARFTGIDIKQACTTFAGQQYPELPVNWISSDYADVTFANDKPDIIFCSLFCHHFPETSLHSMLRWMKLNSSTGFFINDLHRHPLAYYSIKGITKIFSKSYLVKHDAPLSVARGFKMKEWKTIFEAAGIARYRIQWKWAFRHLITCKHDA